MKIHNDNPSTNSMPSNITEDKLLDAVRKSGYPLQVIVARVLQECLGGKCSIQEEWCFPDDNTGELRSIDIVGHKILYDPLKIPNVRPILNIIIECKQSQLPYVFFISEEAGKYISYYFPDFAGLFGDAVCGDEGIIVPISKGIDLANHPFINNLAEYCLTFSKCVRKGKDIELSGSDSYLGLVLPLIKAKKYLKAIKMPTKTAQYFDCHLPLCVGVLDAPMIGIQTIGSELEGIYLPWVRIVRHQGENKGFWQDITAIDIVHKDYFRTYITTHVLPFAEVFAQKCVAYQGRLAEAVCYQDLLRPVRSRKKRKEK